MGGRTRRGGTPAVGSGIRREVAIPPPTVLIISQVYEPDPAAVGQYVADAARRLASRRRVVVYTASRGYDDPSRRYRRRETSGGVEIRRLPLSSSGKGSLLRRIVGQLSFLAQATVRGLFVRSLESVLISTSPPMAPAAAVVIGLARRVPVTYWVMDLNPDQAVVLGEVSAGSPLVRALEWLNRRILHQARSVIALDRFMADRLAAKAPVRHKITILPPWPLSERLEPVPHADNPCRREWGLDGKIVVMHSGNHSPSHPLTTLLAAADRMRDHERLMFAFVGGGLSKPDVDRAIDAGLSSALSLPYQPLGRLRYSLSAADVHVVPVGDHLVGLVHPSKVYNALAVGRPILLIGPDPCHVSDVVHAHGVGWHVHHGDVDGLVGALQGIAALGPDGLAEIGARARKVAEEEFAVATLTRRFCEVVTGEPPSG